jgi:hypothetical protein
MSLSSGARHNAEATLANPHTPNTATITIVRNILPLLFGVKNGVHSKWYLTIAGHQPWLLGLLIAAVSSAVAFLLKQTIFFIVISFPL